jgi:putative ABC transport system permease protein
VTHSPPSNTTVSVETGPTDDTALIAWALLAVAAFIAIASAAVAIGLARVDGRADDATLASLGAGPRTRRDIAFWQSLLICRLGAVVGTGLGILPAFALELPGGTSPFVQQWTQIATIALALPVAIAAASWLLAGRPATLHRRAAVS